MTVHTSDRISATAATSARVCSLEGRLRAVQVSMSADAVRDVALTAPLWATCMTVLFNGVLPDIAEKPLSHSWPWVFLCLLSTACAFALSRAVKARVQGGELQGRQWILLVVGANFVVAATWSLVTWVFWEAGNVANHCFLLFLALGAVTLFLTSRSGNFFVVIAATTPVILMIWGHFLLQALWFDTVMSVIIPVWAVQLHLDSWRACRSVTAAHRTRLEKEALVRELADARDIATQASRAKSAFLANMSHELRTPLNAILGFSEIISAEALGHDARDKYRDYAGDILNSGRHLLSLINDLLDIAKIEAGKLELDCRELDGAEGLHACLSLIEQRARAVGIDLSMSVEPKGLKLYADERAFRQIAINLLSNALKFSEAGGRIEVRLNPAEGGVVLCVTDTGCGIAPDQILRIFEPFEQVDNSYSRANGGTGLGLSLVRALSELHGGRCRIDSEVGKGTKVTIFLPSAWASVGARKMAAA